MNVWNVVKIESIEELGRFQTEAAEVEVNLIKFADKEEKVFDIRKWKTNTNGHKVPLEGISLTVDEFEELKATLESIATE